MNKFTLSALTLALTFAFFTPVAYAEVTSLEEEDEFDSTFLYNFSGQSINIERFRYRNAVLPGEYLSEIYLNQKPIGQYNLTFVDAQNSKAQLCLDRELLAILDLKSEAIKQKPHKNECLNASAVIPQATFEFKPGEQKLAITLPQYLTIIRPRGYISPNRWEQGISTLFTHYRYHYYQTKRHNSHQNTYTYLGLRGGATWNGWTLRHRGSYRDNNNVDKHYQSYDTYLQRDIDAIEGRLTIGDFSTQGRFTDSVSLRGISIASDHQMLPYSQQGFAPSIKGVANSNAKVTIRQNGNIIYETTVPPGPFSIDDLYPNSYSGDLQVEITEDNGAVRHFSVPFAYSSNLIRQGQLWYEAAIGRYRQYSHTYPLNVFQTAFQYGLSNHITLNLGATIANRYTAGQLGIIWQTTFGNIETNINLSRLHNYGQSPSFKTIYSKQLNASKTYIYASAEHFFSKRHYSLNDALPQHYKYLGHQQFEHSIKERYRLSLNQHLGERLGSLYLTGTANRYQQNSTVYGYQVGYSNYYKNIDFQIGYWREQKPNQRPNSQLYANFSIPFNVGNSYHYWRNAYSHNRQGQYIAQTSIYGTGGEYNQFNYGATISKQRNFNAYSANVGYQSPFAKLNATYSHSPNIRQQSYEVSGAIVAHPYGVTLSSALGHTFAIVHAKSASNARIKNQNYHRLDYWGNAIVPYIVPYRINAVGIEIDNLPDDIEISATSKEVIPRANTAHLVKLETQTGRQVFFDVYLPNQTLPPMGAEAFNEQNQQIGYVGQGGRLYIRTEQTKGSIKLIWGNLPHEQCRLNYQLDKKTVPQRVQCRST